MAFTPEGPWRGETHRDVRQAGQPGAPARGGGRGRRRAGRFSCRDRRRPARPHELSASRGDLRGRAGEQLAAFEAATLRDALEHFTGRFAGLFVVRPAHNPLGPLDFDGVYDERSDRTHTLAELLDRGYEDAYRQFIEPVVGASGERITAAQPRNG